MVDLETKKKEADVRKEQQESNKGNATTAHATASNLNASHGGTIRHFKPPAKVGPIGVQAEAFEGPSGQAFTSVKNSEAARMKRMKGKTH